MTNNPNLSNVDGWVQAVTNVHDDSGAQIL